jgi:hypothetical protein
MEAVKYVLYRTPERVTTQLQKSTVRTRHALQKPSLLIFKKSIAGLLFYPFNNSLDELMATTASRAFSHNVFRIFKLKEMEKQ